MIVTRVFTMQAARARRNSSAATRRPREGLSTADEARRSFLEGALVVIGGAIITYRRPS